MVKTGDNLASGFCGPIKGWQGLVPTAERVLRLPSELRSWRRRDRVGDAVAAVDHTPAAGAAAPTMSGAAPAPGASKASEPVAAHAAATGTDTSAAATSQFDLIEVTAFTESMGRIEDAVAELARSLVEGGTLLLAVENLQSARMLRIVLEGRRGSFDPHDNPADPSQVLALRRVLVAVAAAGLSVRDVLTVPTGAEEFAPNLARKVAELGLLPLDWVAGTPPARYWLQCEKIAAAAGSVLLAGGDEAARAATRAALREFLPDDWEIVTGDGIGECAQWNRAVAAARGDIVWFLRAGTEPTAETFAAMSARACIGPVVATCNGELLHPGDLAGMMMPRTDVLHAGPLPEHFANSCVAYEDYLIGLEMRSARTWSVEAPLVSPAAPVENPQELQRESDEMMRRWACFQEGAATEPSSPQAAGAVAAIELGTARAAAATPTIGLTSTRSTAAMPAIEQRSNEQPQNAQPRGAIDPTPVRPATVDSPQLVPRVDRAPRISLCMIARDEERFLGECLERARGCFDEFVLVDTGSTDRTVAIAESHGAIVVHEPWDDDFSAPRNTALQRATGDWILVLDADEFLAEGAAERIREIVREPHALGYHLHFINNYGDGKTLGVMMVRLFRNLPGIEYQNIIHEQVTPSLQRIGEPQGMQLLRSDIEVEHMGYQEAIMTDRNKLERNERLFLKQIEVTPDDVYAHYKYGDFLRRVPGRNRDARRMLERCFELILASSPTLPRALPYAGEVAALAALEAERTGDRARAQELIDIGLRRFVPTPNLHYIAASLALAEKDPETAIHHYRRCLAYRDCVLVVPIQEGITGHVSLAGIAQAWLLRGDLARARRLLEQAIAIEPSYEVAQMALSRLWLEAGDVQRALGVLTDFLARHPDSPGACQQTMLILHRLGNNEAARAMGRHAVRLLEARCLETEAAEVNQLLAKI